MKSVQEKIALMQAFVDGGQIECRSFLSKKGEWVVIENPSWNWQDVDYRIKEDQELKAFNLLWEENQLPTLTPDNRRWMRKIINAVKVGKIQ